MKFSKDTYADVREVCEVATSWLAHSVEKNLTKAMEREERKESSHRKGSA
jgi:hypothetical protein